LRGKRGLVHIGVAFDLFEQGKFAEFVVC